MPSGGFTAQTEPGAGREAGGDGEPLEELMAPRGDTSSPPTPGLSARAAPGTAAIQAPLRQVAEVIGHLWDGPVEVKLRPDDLGLVRMQLHQTETAIVLHVSAERPDTLDLMRRHADLLARELADAGFGSVDIDFGGARGGAAGEDAPKGAAIGSSDAVPAVDEAETAQDKELPRDAGLDIRI